MQQRIVTFPLRFTEEYSDKITQYAKKQGENKHDYITKAIEQRMEKEGKE